MFAEKKIVVLGERDGVAAGAMTACLEAAGSGEVVFAATECFV